MQTKIYRILRLIPIFIMALVYAYAQDGKEYVQELSSYLRYIPHSRAKAQTGKVGIIQSEFEYGYDLKLFGKLPLALTINEEYIAINNSTGLKLPAHLTGFATDLEATLPFFNLARTYMRIGVSPSFYGGSWTFSAANFTIPSRGYMVYLPSERLGEKLILVAGVAIYPGYQDSVLPIAGAIYRPNDKLLFNLTTDRPGVSYALTEKLTIFLEADILNDEFVVSRNEVEKVRLRYAQLHVGSGLSFKINKHIQASLSTGEILNHALKYRDAGGKVSLKNNIYGEFRLLINI